MKTFSYPPFVSIKVYECKEIPFWVAQFRCVIYQIPLSLYELRPKAPILMPVDAKIRKHVFIRWSECCNFLNFFMCYNLYLCLISFPVFCELRINFLIFF